MQIRVYYEDTDIGGIVYHTNYLKFCERARSEVFFDNGVVPLEEDKSGFVVRNINADFLSTATLGDILTVKSKVVTTKSSSVVLLQEVWREDVKVFSMNVLLVYISKGRPSRIPETFKEIFNTFSKI